MIELFTSQGCSSCPPADAVLGALADRDDVVALSFHVDYWDNLGWKDPFAAPQYTARQKAYRVAFHNAQIYTPQMVIGGRAEMVGQDRKSVERSVGDVATKAQGGPDIKIGRDGTGGVTIGAAPAFTTITVWAAAYQPRHETAVRRGENAGRGLVNTNVVRKLVALGTYTGAATTFPLPAAFAGADQGIAVWLQADSLGPIAAAAKVGPVAN